MAVGKRCAQWNPRLARNLETRYHRLLLRILEWAFHLEALASKPKVRKSPVTRLQPPSVSVSPRQPPSAPVSLRQPPSGPCQAPVSPYLPQRRKAIDVALGFPMLGYRCSGAGHRRLGDGRPGAEARVPRSSKISILKDRYLRTTLHGASACP